MRMLSPGPPSRMSWPAPPISTSSPAPPVSVSLPALPIRTSLPSPPLAVSCIAGPQPRRVDDVVAAEAIDDEAVVSASKPVMVTVAGETRAP